MKQLVIALVLSLLCLPSALAADGAAVYKSACAGCHGQSGEKPAGKTQPLKDLSEEQIKERLRGYADGTYGGKNKESMQKTVKRLPPEDLDAAAAFAGTL